MPADKQALRKFRVKLEYYDEDGDLVFETTDVVRAEDLAALAAAEQAQEAQPVAWMRSKDLEHLASMSGGASSFQVANVSFSGWRVPLYTSPTIPEGWRLVPIEPTREMMQAGLSVKAFGREDWHSWDDPLAVYRAMLAAAPKQ